MGQGPQGGVEVELRNGIAESPRLPIDEPDTLTGVEDSIDRAPEENTVARLHFQRLLGALEALGGKHPEPVVQLLDLLDHAPE